MLVILYREELIKMTLVSLALIIILVLLLAMLGFSLLVARLI